MASERCAEALRLLDIDLHDGKCIKTKYYEIKKDLDECTKLYKLKGDAKKYVKKTYNKTHYQKRKQKQKQSLQLVIPDDDDDDDMPIVSRVSKITRVDDDSDNGVDDDSDSDVIEYVFLNSSEFSETFDSETLSF